MAALPLQDVAIALEVPDATTVPAAVAKLVRVVASLPRLEAFVGQVCEVRQHMGCQVVDRNCGCHVADRDLQEGVCSGCTRVGAPEMGLGSQAKPSLGRQSGVLLMLLRTMLAFRIVPAQSCVDPSDRESHV